MIRKQQGQVLPVGLALVLFGMLGGFVLFNTGQVASDKMSLANTADAAAYSGSLWQARALNFQSYTNRAMVANQVSIGQAVTLQSWVAYGAIASENIATVLKPVPVINVIAEGLQRGLDIVDRVVSPVTSAIVSVVDVVNRGLSMSQQAMFVSTFAATPDVVRSVVRENDARFSVNTGFSGLGLANNLEQWRSLTDGYDADDAAAMDERMQMINDSRDGFTRERNWKFFNFWFYSTPLLRHQMRREGTTRLIRVDTPEGIEWEWKAKDTLSLHNRLWHWKGTRRYEVPIGWAEAFANSRNSDKTIEPGACTSVSAMQRQDCARFLGINRRGEYLADIGQRSIQGTESRIAMRHYTGVQAYRSLSTASIEAGAPQLRLKVEVALPVDEVSGSDALGSRGQLAAPVQAPGERISSVSVAEVYYKRPDADLPGIQARQLEPANGYNPYWGARLSAVSAEDRLLAFALRPGGGFVSTPDAVPAELAHSSHSLSTYDDGNGAGSESDPSTSGIRQSVQDFDSVAAGIGTEQLAQLRQDIEQQLVEALKQQIKDLLAGSLAGAVGSGAQTVDELQDDLSDMASEAVGDLTGTEVAQQFADVIAHATTMAETLEEEFKAIRQRIVNEFQFEFETARATLETQTADLKAQIATLQERLRISNLNEDSLRPQRQVLSDMQAQLRDSEDAFRQSLANRLMAIVNQSASLYIMRFDEAVYLVDEFLRLENPEISLPWLEFVEEDDSDD